MATRIDATKTPTPFVDEHYCDCCGAEDKPLLKYGTAYHGTMYWSAPLCSIECHDALFPGDDAA
jgi:hypothetical protein